MKKLLSLTLALAIIICAVPLGTFTFTASAATSGTTGACTWRLDGTVLTISGNGAMGNYYEKHYTSPWGRSVTKAIIEDGVTSIGEYAFDLCTNLTSITIPNSVTSIGEYAFDSCESLTSIIIPDSVTSIGWSAFEDCSSLTSITMPDSVTSIGKNAFYNTAYYNDENNWENKVLYIGKHLIDAKSDISGEYTIKTGVLTIADIAFLNRTNITSMTIPNSVTSIGEDAFYGCTGLKGIYITDIAAWCNIDFDSIAANPLYYAKNLYLNGGLVTNLAIPDSVTSIGDYAFSNCSGLTSVTIGDGVTSIGDYAFSNCSGLTSITIPASVKSMGVYACGHCENIYISDIAAWCSIDIYATSDPTSFYGAYTEHNLYLNGELVEHLVIPEDVTSIGNYAFYKCMSLKSVVIPESVEQVGICAFWGSSLEKISLESQEPFEFDAWSFYGLDNITDIFYKNYSSWQYFTTSVFSSKTVSHYNTCKYTNHIYPSECANGCNICDWTREANGEHTYSSRCDTKCDGCERSRYTDVAHTYINAIDVSCELCGEVRCVETWLIETGKTGIYDIKPNKALNGFTKDSISVFDKNDNLVKYNDEKQGWPLVGGQEYKVVLNDEFNYSNLYWNLVEKSQTIFPDTSSGAWYNDSVTYAVGAGIISGYSNGKFGTSDSIKRQDFLVILARLDGVNLDDYKYKSSFPDVSRNSYYEAAVNWGAQNGIVTGYQNGKFGVGDKVTREQLVTFLYRYAKYKGYDSDYSSNRENAVSRQYKDYKNVSGFAKQPILWAIEKGVISGKTSSTIAPQGNAQRCEVAKIMYNIYLNDIFN